MTSPEENKIAATDDSGIGRESQAQKNAAAVRKLVGVVYGTPSLDEKAGTERLNLIVQGRNGALAGMSQTGQPYHEGPTAALKHEWGLGLVKHSSEVVLVIGDPTGVSWSNELLDVLDPLAHTHPYFKNGPARLAPKRSGQGKGAVSTVTKEMADHQIGTKTVNGAALWGDLTKKGGEGNERAKIFPSALDVSFAAKHRLSSHMVYTPYLVVQVSNVLAPAGLVIANPDFADRLSELDQDGFTAVSRGRLNFKITDARFVMAKGYPLCRLDVFMDNVLFCTLTNVLTTVKGTLAKPEKAPDGTIADLERTPNNPTDTVTALDTLDLTHATVTAHQ